MNNVRQWTEELKTQLEDWGYNGLSTSKITNRKSEYKKSEDKNIWTIQNDRKSSERKKEG